MIITCLKKLLYNILNNSSAKKFNTSFLFIIKKSRMYHKNIRMLVKQEIFRDALTLFDSDLTYF